jgi:hypothetical protein
VICLDALSLDERSHVSQQALLECCFISSLRGIFATHRQRLRILASSSAAPLVQRRAAASSSALRLALLTPSVHVRKPCSPSLFNVAITPFFEPPPAALARGPSGGAAMHPDVLKTARALKVPIASTGMWPSSESNYARRSQSAARVCIIRIKRALRAAIL